MKTMNGYLTKTFKLDNGREIDVEFCGQVDWSGVGPIEIWGHNVEDKGVLFCTGYQWAIVDGQVLSDGEMEELEAIIQERDEDICAEIVDEI